jgi:hypothetical protein
LSEIVPAKWVCTADAISKLLSGDDEWCRLSDLFHSRPSYIKARRRKRLEMKQDALLDPVHSDVATGNLVVVLLSQTDRGEWMEHQLPAKYLESPELPSALNTGQAGKLTLTGPDTKFTNASLYFRKSDWERRLSPNPLSQPSKGENAVGNNPSRANPLFVRDSAFELTSPGGGTIPLKAGNRAYNDKEVVEEVRTAVKRGTYKSYRDAALAMIDKVKGSGTPESRARRIARKASRRR